jgi:CDP-diacylglycerol---glycerol-3-phosphate 3-phosphatidyltransferase
MKIVVEERCETYLHDRILDKLLLWAIPRRVTPNSVTWIRVILTPLVVYVNQVGNFRVGIPLFLFVAFTDAIDGSLARTRNQVTNFGKLFDPVADKLLIGSMIVVLLIQNVDIRLAYAVIGIEVVTIVVAGVRWISGYVSQANRYGKIKMVLQIIAVCLILIGLTSGNQFLFGLASWIFGAATLFAIVSLFFHGV